MGGSTGVLLVSENDYEQNHYLLQRLIKRAGFQREHFSYCTLEGLEDAGEHKVIVPLGEAALRRLTGEPGIERWRGRVVASENGAFIVPTFKPSKLLHARRNPFAAPDPEALRNPPRYQKNVIRDLHYAVHVAKHGFERQRTEYLLDPSPSQFHEWVQDYLARLAANPNTLLSFDIETPYKKKIVEEEELEEAESDTDLNTLILRISFSYEPLKAVTIPWDVHHYEAIRTALASSGAKVGWNFLYFDIPVLAKAGFPVNGKLYDGMDAWHWLYPQQDKGLEYVSAEATDVLPWKHLSDLNPEWYSAADSDVALRNILYTFDRIQKNGAWEAYQDLAVEVMDYMRAAGARGVPADRAMQAVLAPEMDAEIARLDAIIQKEVPERLKPRKRYKRTPECFPDIIDLSLPRIVTTDGVAENPARTFLRVEEPGEVKVCSECGASVSQWADHMKGRAKGTKKDPDVFNRCKAAGAKAVMVPGTLVEWDEILPFNANSSGQLIAYMHAHKHPVGKNKKSPEVDSADAAHLRDLVGMFDNGSEGLPEESDFPLYALALKLHDVKKARTTYMPTPDEFDMLHTTYTNTPWTWRFGSRAINMQTWGKREEKIWARKARLQIIARPGYRFVQADSSSAEAVIQAWWMGDMDLMAVATQSTHGWLSTKYLGWDWNPDTFAKVKKEQKKVYDGMKVSWFTLNFGGSAYGMHMSNKKLFPKKADAERIVDAVYDLVPKLGDYHWNLRGLAQKQGFIKSPWGIRFDFFDVYTYDRDQRTGDIRYTKQGRPMLKLGKDGKAVVAALPQHSNGMFSRENAVIIGRSDWGQYMPASFAVHDSYKLRVPVELEDKAAEFLIETLTRPIEKLGNLRIGAEVERGDNWGDYDEHSNPGGMRSIAKKLIPVSEQRFSYMPNFAADFAAVAGKAA
jgi:hypothetical protein